jgi:hypothetical protein
MQHNLKHAPAPARMADTAGEDDLAYFTARPNINERTRLPIDGEFPAALLRPGAFVHVRLLTRDPLTNEPRTRARAIFYSDLNGGRG